MRRVDRARGEARHEVVFHLEVRPHVARRVSSVGVERDGGARELEIGDAPLEGRADPEARDDLEADAEAREDEGAVPAGQEEAVRRGLAVHEIGPRRRRRRARAEERETEAEALRDAERARDLRVRSELDVVADAREIARRVGQRLGRGVPCGLDARKACMMHAQVRLNRHARVLPGEARRVEEGGQRIARARDPCPAATELLGAVVRKLGHVRRPCFARRDEGTHDHEADEVPGRARGPREPASRAEAHSRTGVALSEALPSLTYTENFTRFTP